MKLGAPGEYATMPIAGKRRDLCFETCYKHYERMLDAEEKLANEVAEELAAKRREIVERFRQEISPGPMKDGNGGIEITGSRNRI